MSLVAEGGKSSGAWDPRCGQGLECRVRVGDVLLGAGEHGRVYVSGVSVHFCGLWTLGGAMRSWSRDRAKLEMAALRKTQLESRMSCCGVGL